MYCFAFCSVWGLYCEWFFIFQMSADPIILFTSQFASPTQVSDNAIASTMTDWGKRLTSIELFHLKMSWSHFTCFAMNFYKRMDSPTRFDFCEYRCWYPAEVSYILEPSIFVDTGTQYLLVSWILEPSIFGSSCWPTRFGFCAGSAISIFLQGIGFSHQFWFLQWKLWMLHYCWLFELIFDF